MRSLFIFTVSLINAFFLISQDEQINFQSDGLILNGTLSIPENGDEPFPLAILVHGSGPNDRSQTITLSGGNSLCLYPGLLNQTIKNFEDIADHLSENGIAVLRYDKRTLTHGQVLTESEVLVSDFVIDIESAINYSINRNDIDEDQIFLIGHSQGSSLIPIAAENTGNIKGLISLAGPTTPIDSLLPEQFRNLFIECANDPTSGENVANQFYSQFEEIRNGTFPLDEQIVLNLPGNPNPIPQGYGSFWADWIQISDEVLQNYMSAGIKSLIIQGDDDFNVPYEDANDFSVLADAEIKIYEGINHYLTTANDNKVSIDILQDIVDWIQSCVTSTTESVTDDKHDIKVYRVENELIAEMKTPCQNCILNVYGIDGRSIESRMWEGHKTSVSLPPDNNYRVVQIIGTDIRVSRLVK